MRYPTDPTYKHWLHTKDWHDLREAYMIEHPWCEECLPMRGRVPATECHHRQAVLSFPSLAQRRFMMFNYNNLQALCSECHKKKHNRREQKAHQQERAKSKIEFFKEKYGNNLGRTTKKGKWRCNSKKEACTP